MRTLSRLLPLLCALALPAGAALAQDASCPAAQEGVEVLGLEGAQDYRTWLKQQEWRDLKPLSNSARRFAVEGGALRLETRGEGYLIGRRLPAELQRSLESHPYMRFEARLVQVPPAARMDVDGRDDSPLRVFAVFREKPLQSLGYVWSGEEQSPDWKAGRKIIFGDFRRVHRKVIGHGAPDTDGWLTVEVNVANDFQERFGEDPERVVGGIAVQADSEELRSHTVALLRSVSLHQRSLRTCGLEHRDRLGDTRVWFADPAD